jgi:hypothetical protein
LVGQREDGAVGTDAERERKDRDPGEHRRLAQRANSKAKIQSHARHAGLTPKEGIGWENRRRGQRLHFFIGRDHATALLTC